MVTLKRLLPALLLSAALGPLLVAGAASQARPGYAVGRVTLPDGTPVAGAVIRVDGTNDQGGLQSFTTKTNAQGAYTQRVIGGVYTVTAWVPRTYNGVTGYVTSAEPTRGTDDDEFDTHRGGIVRDFVWKISGLKPGADPHEGRNYYGGFGRLGIGSPKYEDRASGAVFPPDAVIEVTLTPTGPLLDGRPGTPLTLRTAGVAAGALKEMQEWGSAFVGAYQDIPTGRYRVTARMITPAGARVARVGAYVKSGSVGGANAWLPPASVQVIQWQPNSSDLNARSVQDIDLYVLP